jgi:squalene-associated FAD-dependent desaturase
VKAVVVGGGLAGLSAALELADGGSEVTLLEARPTLGGAVQTLPAREGDPDPPPDNGQHIALGCFRSYGRFLRRIGKADALRREPFALPVLDERGRTAFIRVGAAGLLRYGHLSLSARARIARVVRRLAALAPEEVEGTFGELLRALGQRDEEIDRFWDVFVRPALNLRTDEVGASYGLFTVQTALLGARDASDLLLPVEPLGEMHGAAAAKTLAGTGATVRTDARVAELEHDAVVLADGERVGADAIVLAVPPTEAARLLDRPPPALDDSPIVSVHLLFDRKLLGHPLAALLGSDAHWVFDRGALTTRQPERGQYLTVVSSGAPELLEVRGREMVDLMASEITERLGPAEVLWSRVSREPRATFAPRPGSEAERWQLETDRPNVLVAGAWTSSAWPATMEAAVASGERAASALLAEERAWAVTR